MQKYSKNYAPTRRFEKVKIDYSLKINSNFTKIVFLHHLRVLLKNSHIIEGFFIKFSKKKRRFLNKICVNPLNMCYLCWIVSISFCATAL